MTYAHLLDALTILAASAGISGLLFLLGEAVYTLTGRYPSPGFSQFMNTAMDASRVAIWVMVIGSIVFALAVLTGL